MFKTFWGTRVTLVANLEGQLCTLFTPYIQLCTLQYYCPEVTLSMHRLGFNDLQRYPLKVTAIVKVFYQFFYTYIHIHTQSLPTFRPVQQLIFHPKWFFKYISKTIPQAVTKILNTT